MNFLFVDMIASIQASGIGITSVAYGFKEHTPGCHASTWLLIAGFVSLLNVFVLLFSINYIPWSKGRDELIECPSRRCLQNFLLYKVFHLIWQMAWFSIGVAIMASECSDLQVVIQLSAYPISALASLVSCVNLNHWLK